MHGKANIHGTIEIGHGFGFTQSRAGHFVGLNHHAIIIGTGLAHMGVMVDSSSNWHTPGSLLYVASDNSIQDAIVVQIQDLFFEFLLGAIFVRIH